MNDTTSYNQPFIDLCYLTCRVMFMSRRLVFVTRRIVFVTHRVQKCSYVKFSKSLIFVSSSEAPTGIPPPQSILLCYIGVLSSTREENSLYSSKVYVVFLTVSGNSLSNNLIFSLSSTF